MALLRLHLLMHPRTGMPTLHDPQHMLLARDFAKLAKQLQARYDRLVTSDGSCIDLKFQLHTLAERARFRIRVAENSRNLRCPTVTLLHEPKPRPRKRKRSPSTVPEWVEGFLAELEEIETAQRWEHPAAPTTALEKKIDQLRGLARRKPEELATILLKGYLRVPRASLETNQPRICNTVTKPTHAEGA